jgi:hypothetical protein
VKGFAPFTSEILDRMTRRNFEGLEQNLRAQEVAKFDWKKMDIEVPAASTNLLIAHDLGYVPQDVIVTRQTGTGAITFLYEDFTDKFLVVTTTGPVTVRALVGAYRENFE